MHVQKVFTIMDICAAEVLDSRGTPTVACSIKLQDGSSGFMQVPSGASTGQYEATELRDADQSRYFGKGVLQAVWNIESYAKQVLKNQSFDSIKAFDDHICALDATVQKSRLGANALLAMSGAFARAAAAATAALLCRTSGEKFVTNHTLQVRTNPPYENAAVGRDRHELRPI